MDITPLALLVTAILGGIGGLITAIAALMGTRQNTKLIEHERDESKQEADELRREVNTLRNEIAEEKRSARIRDDIARTNIILMGESMGNLRSDNAKLALIVNQLFKEFEKVTGQPPPVDLEMLKHMRTVEYITGPLGPLDIPEK